MSDRTIFIGDLHGCFNEAQQLMNKLQLTSRDRVLFLGDYVDRGPNSAGCVDLVRHREQVQGTCAGILGNHEEKMLQYCQRAMELGHEPPNIPFTHVETRKQLHPEHYDWFRQLPMYVRLPQHNAVAVHAGVFPGRSIEEQTARTLLHVQMLKPYDAEGRDLHKDGKRHDSSCWPSKVPAGEEHLWKFWTNFWDGSEFVVFGHSVLDKPLITDKVAGIDGGVPFGLALHALILPERRIVTVQAKTNYSASSHRSRKRTEIATFAVHGDVKSYS